MGTCLLLRCAGGGPNNAYSILLTYLPSESALSIKIIQPIAGGVLLQPGRSGPKGIRSVRATATWGPGGGRGSRGCGGWGPGLLRRLMNQQPNLLLLLPGAGPRIKRPVYGLRVDSHHCWVRLLCPCPSSLKVVGWSSDLLRAFSSGAVWSERLPGSVQPIGCMTVRRLPVHSTPEGSFKPETRLGVISARR